MIIEALLVSTLVALVSVVGVFFFGSHKGLVGIERLAIPLAVGFFMSLVLVELIPETLEASSEFGPYLIAFGFLAFYILAQYLHKKFHNHDDVLCRHKSAANLVLIGDAVHNFADGIVLGGAFLIDPALGAAAAFSIALHEVPMELAEYGVLIRAGYTRLQALARNLISASSIVFGTMAVIIIGIHVEEWLFVVLGIAAGNLLFIALSELLPRIHSAEKEYGSISAPVLAMVCGFILMSAVLNFAHNDEVHGHTEQGNQEEYEHEDEHEHVIINGKEFDFIDGELIQ